MAPSLDCAVSSLLCAEDNRTVFYDDAENGGFRDVHETWPHRNHRNFNQHQSYKFEMDFDLPLPSDECYNLMLQRECEQFCGIDYSENLRSGNLDLVGRDEAVDWIRKVHAHFSFGPLSACLSINYLDRFLHSYEVPRGKAWMMQLLAIACLSLAAKMEETEAPLSLDLQVGESRYVFESRTIQRMELVVLSKLRWRMQAITPFSFLDFFLGKINGDQPVPNSSILRSTELILRTLKGYEFLEFKPSEIAAAVAISVARETQAVETERAKSALVQYVVKEKMLGCLELVNDLSQSLGGASSSVPQSPIGVLDAACFSYKTDDSAAGSFPNSAPSSPPTKRRKPNTPAIICDAPMVKR